MMNWNKEKSNYGDQTSNFPLPLKRTTPGACSNCGKTFNEPIELNVLTSGLNSRYLACPYCFSPINQETVELESPCKEQSEETTHEMKETLSENLPDPCSNNGVNTGEKVTSTPCKHFVGYLKTRQKGDPMPDECLTCNSVIECM